MSQNSLTCWTGRLAIQCQVLNLDGNEIDTLAGFMGHSKTIHEKFYGLLSDVLQVAKETKMGLSIISSTAKDLNQYCQVLIQIRCCSA